MTSLYSRPVSYLFSLLLLFSAAAAPAVAGQPSSCCPADLNGSSVVDGADLGILLGEWGGPGSADFNSSGTVDGADLGILLGAWGACPVCPFTLVTGSVLFEDGAPLAGAVIVTDLGGEGVSIEDGTFAFEVNVPEGVTTLYVTAVAEVDGAMYMGTSAETAIHLGGETWVGAVTVYEDGIQTCDELEWVPTFGSAPLGGTVYALTVFDDGSGGGPALYAGGSFTTAGGVTVNRIAKWNGSTWSPLGSGMNNVVYALTVFDDGSGGGPALYVGGGFTTAGGVTANRIAKWNGSTWSPLGSGMNATVYALTSLSVGSGAPVLYAGGQFGAAGGVAANRVARWNGSTWSPLGSGIPGVAEVNALTIFDAGTGPALYVGGWFSVAGGVTAYSIARWNGSTWSPVGQGLYDYIYEGKEKELMPAFVYALTVFDDGLGGGPALYAGGSFSSLGSVSGASNIAKWNGTSWSPLVGGGWSGGGLYKPGDVNALFVFDDKLGGGPALYVGGYFSEAFPPIVWAKSIAKWNGSTWSALGSGFGPGFSLQEVSTLAAFDDGSGGGPALYAGGSFTVSPGGDSYLARWGCPPTSNFAPPTEGMISRSPAQRAVRSVPHALSPSSQRPVFQAWPYLARFVRAR